MGIYVDDNDIKVLQLYSAGHGRDAIAKETGLSQGRVSQSLEKGRSIFGPDPFSCIEYSSRVYRKVNDGKAALNARTLGLALRIIDLASDTNLSLDQFAPFLAQLFSDCQSQGIGGSELAEGMKPLVAEAAQQGKPMRDVIAETLQNTKQKAVIVKDVEAGRKELAESAPILQEVRNYVKVKQVLKERGHRSICEDQDKMANFMSNVEENESDFQKVASTLAEKESDKVERHREEEELQAVRDAKASEQAELAKINKELSEGRMKVDGLNDLYSLGFDQGTINLMCRAIKGSNIRDLGQFTKEILVAGGLRPYNEKMAVGLTTMNQLAQERLKNLDKISADSESAARIRDYALNQAAYYQRQSLVTHGFMTGGMEPKVNLRNEPSTISREASESQPHPFLDIINGKESALGFGSQAKHPDH